MARISWIVLLVFAVLLVNFISNSPVESATKRRALNSRSEVLRMVTRNIPTPFRGTNQSQLLRKRTTTTKRKRYNNPFPNYHRRSVK
ncbi:unnamed protein product [Rhizophagus irregularis]|uniref:Uncharacterized protein n=1 Tax=Rhizophagus irregularis TaxID=588596 RepID=A0A2I1H179_9GLOM|nr:hypothetical protein RhiirA4_408472 [Rhizophagus irregularis]CAB4388437.1 unnamed protein product [Rhizophagus irregularis]CAB4414933.1 unnamed protein product [Rhizophagus irregularis]CAB5381636.1 unnamed protein product [Rhizophagus irregularis]